jgi:hypothetical protein
VVSRLITGDVVSRLITGDVVSRLITGAPSLQETTGGEGHGPLAGGGRLAPPVPAGAPRLPTGGLLQGVEEVVRLRSA